MFSFEKKRRLRRAGQIRILGPISGRNSGPCFRTFAMFSFEEKKAAPAAGSTPNWGGLAGNWGGLAGNWGGLAGKWGPLAGNWGGLAGNWGRPLGH